MDAKEVKEVEEIKEFFSSTNHEAVVIMKTSRAGQEVDNGYGVEFGLAPYAVIHKNNTWKMEWRSKLYDFQDKIGFDIMCFNEKNCNTLDGIVRELYERDDYKVMYRKGE